MMKPKATKVYVPKMDEIARDLVNIIKSSKDAENRMTDDFLPFLRKWALESVCYVFMDQRIGLLEKEVNPVAEKFLADLQIVMENFYIFDFLPSIWKFYKTKAFKDAMRTSDETME